MLKKVHLLYKNYYFFGDYFQKEKMDKIDKIAVIVVMISKIKKHFLYLFLVILAF